MPEKKKEVKYENQTERKFKLTQVDSLHRVKVNVRIKNGEKKTEM